MVTGVETEFYESYEGLRSALDASGVVGVWDWDIVRRTARYDRGAAFLLALDPGLAGQSLHGDTAMVGIHPEDREWLKTGYQRALHGGGLFLSEYRVILPSMGTRWLLSRGRIYQDELGRPVRCKGILIDITDTLEDSIWRCSRSVHTSPAAPATDPASGGPALCPGTCGALAHSTPRRCRPKTSPRTAGHEPRGPRGPEAA